MLFRPIDALNVLCAQLTRDLFAIAKFLFIFFTIVEIAEYGIFGHLLAFLIQSTSALSHLLK